MLGARVEPAFCTRIPLVPCVLLYDELVKRLTQAELALNKQSYELFEDSVHRGIDITQYLSDTLDPQYEISHELDRLYEYMIYELGRAKIGRHLEPLAHVKTMAGELRESFREAQKTSGAGKQAAE